MPSINIVEQDLTTGGGRATNLNVVYVPGFMSDDTSKDTTTGAATGAWPLDKDKNVTTEFAAAGRTPTMCYSVAEFEKYFGKKPAVFDDGTFDKSYVYAKELLNLGLPVLYESMNGVTEDGTISDPTANAVEDAITDTENNLFKNLEDKGNYQFKYLTTGAYPIYKSTATKEEGSDPAWKKMSNLAATRGDCIALIDHEEDVEKLSTLYDNITADAKDTNGADCCAMFTPWVNIDSVVYTHITEENSVVNKESTFSMPPSFAYLSALAKSIKTNASWLAVAGATRGQIPNLNGKKPLEVDELLTNSKAESFQNRDGISINAITEIKPFGHRIWGNRTLKDNSVEGNLTATSFLNTRNMICDVKKIVYEACRKYTFEQNNDVLWLNFKSYIEPTLNQMKTGAGLSGYKIIKGATDEKAKLVATIKLYPLYAVEDFDITVQMLDDEIAVS